jgi:hypothetical protein
MKRSALLLAIATVAVAVAAAPASAQPGPHPMNSQFQLRFGYFVPEGGGQFWSDTESAFSLDGQDFDDFDFGMTFVQGVSNNLEIGFNLDFFESTVRSSYIDWVDEDGFPILHDSTLSLTPVTVDIRLLPGGRQKYRGSRSQYAVRKPTGYLGAGAGLVFYQYEEVGDFLDFTSDPPVVFPASYRDDGVAPEIHILGGLDIPVGPGWSFLIEGRYSWCKTDLEEDFSGLGEIDLGGFSGFFGAAFHF